MTNFKIGDIVKVKSKSVQCTRTHVITRLPGKHRYYILDNKHVMEQTSDNHGRLVERHEIRLVRLFNLKEILKEWL